MKNTQRLSLVAAFLTLASSLLLGQSTAPLRIEKGVKLILDLETPLDSGTTREQTEVFFRVRQDIAVDGRIALPRDTRIKGTAIRVSPAIVNGKPKHAEIQIRLEEVILANGKNLRFAANVIKLEPEANRPPSQNMPMAVGLPMMMGSLLGARLGLAGGPIGVGLGIGIANAVRGKSKGIEVVLLSGAVVETRLAEPLEIPDPALLGPAPPAAPAPPVDTIAPVSQPDTGNTGGPAAVSLDAPAPPAQPGATATDVFSVASNNTAAADAGPPPPAAISTAASGAYTIRVNVKLVQVDAVIHDRAGKPMTIVQKEDFRIFEDGVEQQVQAFSRDELPLAVALVVDRSGSVAPFMNRIQTAAFRALQQLKASDRACLFSFSGDVTLLEPLTSNLQRVANRIGTIQAGGGTRIVDAVDEALHYLDRQAPDQRKAIILISDNVEGPSYTGLDQVVQHALEAETVVYSVRINAYSPASALNLPTAGLRLPGPQNRSNAHDPITTIARETGGEIFDATGSDPDLALATAVTRLKLRYTVGYYPVRSASGRYHAIDVRLADRFGRPGLDYTVLSRRGYYE
jgi:Ca-activated chloride channel family protein